MPRYYSPQAREAFPSHCQLAQPMRGCSSCSGNGSVHAGPHRRCCCCCHLAARCDRSSHAPTPCTSCFKSLDDYTSLVSGNRDTDLSRRSDHRSLLLPTVALPLAPILASVKTCQRHDGACILATYCEVVWAALTCAAAFLIPGRYSTRFFSSQLLLCSSPHQSSSKLCCLQLRTVNSTGDKVSVLRTSWQRRSPVPGARVARVQRC